MHPCSKGKIVLNQVMIMTDNPSEELEYDHDNPLPYGGFTDNRGNIKAFTKEEHDEMLERMRKAFRSER
jgi:hypothetical protein